MRRYRRTTLISAFCLAVLAGLGLARKIDFVPSPIFLILVVLAVLVRSRRAAAMLIIVCLGLGLGLWRGGLYAAKANELKQLSYQKITVQATATADSVYSTKSQIEFTANNINLTNPENKQLVGSFKISGFGERMVYRGDRVEVSGKLYPMRGSNQGRIAYAKLTKLSAGDNFIVTLTRRFNAGMQSALPEPQASFGLGLLIGQRTNLPATLTAALTAVGLIHIVAVSGYNLTIIVRAIGRLKLGSKYQKLVLSLVLIVGFVLVTGFSASIVRAALVSILSLWAWYYGRRVKPVVLISFAAAVTALWNPFYLWSDLGWYLSFLAFFGVLVIAPLVTAKFFKKTPKLLTLVLIETLAAEVMTLPLILMSFSQLSLVALLANLLVVPLVPLAMLLSSVAGLSGMLIPQLAGWLALPARLVLTYMLDVVHALSGIPSVLVHRSISSTYMIAIYAVIVILVAIGYKKLPKIKNSKLHEKPANS